MIWFFVVLVVGVAMFAGSIMMEQKGTVGEPSEAVLALRLAGVIVACLGLTGAAIAQSATAV